MEEMTRVQLEIGKLQSGFEYLVKDLDKATATVDVLNRTLTSIETRLDIMDSKALNHPANCPYDEEKIKTIIRTEMETRGEKKLTKYSKLIGLIISLSVLLEVVKSYLLG